MPASTANTDLRCVAAAHALSCPPGESYNRLWYRLDWVVWVVARKGWRLEAANEPGSGACYEGDRFAESARRWGVLVLGLHPVPGPRPGSATGAMACSKRQAIANTKIDGGGASMDFSAKLESLKAKVDEVVASARAAAADDLDQLKQRVDQAQDDANKVVADAKQRADETADRAQRKWAHLRPTLLLEERTSGQRSTSGLISWTLRRPPRTRIGPRRMRPTPSTTPSWLSLTRNWRCSTRSTRALAQTNGPRSPAARPRPSGSPSVAG